MAVSEPVLHPIRARRCLPILALFFITLLVLGNLPRMAADMSQAFGDKHLHFAAYGCMAALLYMSFNRHAFWAGWMGTLVLGIVDETIQSFVPYRSASLLDLLADAIGAGGTVIFLHLIRTAMPQAWQRITRTLEGAAARRRPIPSTRVSRRSN